MPATAPVLDADGRVHDGRFYAVVDKARRGFGRREL